MKRKILYSEFKVKNLIAYQNSNELFSISSKVILLRSHMPRKIPLSNLKRFAGVSNSYQKVKNTFLETVNIHLQLFARGPKQGYDRRKELFEVDLKM